MALDLLPLPVFLSWKCRTAQLAGAKAWSTAPHAVVTTMPQLYCIVNVALVGSNLCTGAPGVCLAAAREVCIQDCTRGEDLLGLESGIIALMGEMSCYGWEGVIEHCISRSRTSTLQSSCFQRCECDRRL
jgi:hypothetical protein